jgi:hypothetical protein
MSKMPRPVLRALLPIMPIYIWVGVRGSGQPAGPRLTIAPQRLG